MAQPERESAVMYAAAPPSAPPVSVIADSRDFRHELLGMALLAGALFAAGALLSGAAAPARSCWAANGAFGPAGACGRSLVMGLVGPFGATFVPFFLVLYALRALGRLDAITVRRWRSFAVGLLVLVITGAALARAGRSGVVGIPQPPNVLGGALSRGLSMVFGATGAWVVLLLALCVLAATLDLKPMRFLAWRARRRLRDGYRLHPDPRSTLETAVPRERRRHRRPAEQRVWRDETAVPAAAGSALPCEASTDALPPLDLLAAGTTGDSDANTALLDVIGYRLEGALRTLKLDGQLVGRTTGPAITRFEIQPAPMVKLAAFAALAGDLAAAMKVRSIRIEAPIPGRGAVGVEVPNPNPEVVHLRDVLELADDATVPRALALALGRDLAGKSVIADLGKMPNLMIAGAPGGGSSVCVNGLVASLVMRHTPRTLRFLMVGLGHRRLDGFDALPHLRHPVATNDRDATAILAWAVREMHERYRLLSASGARNVQEFNKTVLPGPALSVLEGSVAGRDHRYMGGTLPYLVLILDEIAAVLPAGSAELEGLARQGRAVGIHLIAATREPSEEVISRIREHFPSRIALRVRAPEESRAVLDCTGAESLLGRGDMLFMPPGKSAPIRLQGAFLSAADTSNLLRWHAPRHGLPELATEVQGLKRVEPSPVEQCILVNVSTARTAAA